MTQQRERRRRRREPEPDGERGPDVVLPAAERTPHQELLTALWGGQNPFDFADPRQVDGGYPDTSLPDALVEALLRDLRPRFWLELGTALGNSALRTAEVCQRLDLPTTIGCLDSFTGDVNMWAWEQGRRERAEWRYLRVEAGRPTMYERFLANVQASSHGDRIVPLYCTTQVGLRLLRLLHEEGRLSHLPEVIYLDGAHEPGETLLELQNAWLTLAPGGVLFGDDWLWPSVRGDVQTFARTVETDSARLVAYLRRFPDSELDGNVLLYRGHWVLFKLGS